MSNAHEMAKMLGKQCAINVTGPCGAFTGWAGMMRETTPFVTKEYLGGADSLPDLLRSLAVAAEKIDAPI